jgi:GRIP domain
VTIAESGSRDAKLSYIKNLMVNYLSSDQAVRDHMEGAIGTVLKFTPDEMARIEKKKQEQQDAWF